jgi:hypothetical protein
VSLPAVPALPITTGTPSVIFARLSLYIVSRPRDFVAQRAARSDNR